MRVRILLCINQRVTSKLGPYAFAIGEAETLKTEYGY